MARPLRKRKLDGALYERRLVVAEEIAEIGNLELDDLVARCQRSPKSTSGYVSSEAVLYYVRAIPLDTAHGESLFKILMWKWNFRTEIVSTLLARLSTTIFLSLMI